MQWTDADVAFDAQLRLRGYGFGKMCEACSERGLEIMERQDAEYGDDFE
jgi:hypothetical protein